MEQHYSISTHLSDALFMFKILNEFVIFLNQYQDYSRFKDCFSIYTLTPFHLVVRRERERGSLSCIGCQLSRSRP